MGYATHIGKKEKRINDGRQKTVKCPGRKLVIFHEDESLLGYSVV
jgi:hypothetical protein